MSDGKIGREIGGRYKILEQLGAGGMATVYKAYDCHLDREVAVKVIRREVFALDEMEMLLKRFEREAKSVARLSHPNIVGVIDYGEFEGEPYLVMEYLPGGTLKDQLGRPIPWREAIQIILPIARALEYVHSRNIINRDVKPSNVLLTENGEPMLTDFGLVKIFGEKERGTTSITSSGTGLGAPDYMAPEQWTGEATARSDLYSLGVVLYEMITGHRPYIADTPAGVLLKQANEPLPLPTSYIPNLPKDIESVLLKVLAKDPAHRYTDMAALVDELENLQAGRAATASSIRTEQLREQLTGVAQKPPAPTIAVPKPGLIASPPPQPTSTSVVETPVSPATATQTVPPTETLSPTITVLPTEVPPTVTATVSHVLVPPDTVKTGELIHDVVCVDTAAEQRAPYGDSYDINLFERPFLQDMRYIPDLDIISYNLNKDDKFYYVSIALVGADPNNELSIQYGVELDLDADGFGDIMIVARPPHSVEWSTDNVQVVADSDHDTGGLSAERSDAPLPGNGYDTVIFDGGRGAGDDPDLAWVRINAGKDATVQFAFKRTLAENRFMFGVIADAGPRIFADLDYVDRFTEEEAGSPVKGDADYPLKALFGVDNTCREAQGFTGTGEEPQRCPLK